MRHSSSREVEGTTPFQLGKKPFNVVVLGESTSEEYGGDGFLGNWPKILGQKLDHYFRTSGDDRFTVIRNLAVAGTVTNKVPPAFLKRSA
jgi:hypothetical protein